MLTKSQIKQLRALAHPLNVVLQTGDKGLTQAVQDEIAIALNAHELIKVKLNDERPQREQMIEAIITNHHCELVQYIGKTVVIYKRNPDNPKININTEV